MIYFYLIPFDNAVHLLTENEFWYLNKFNIWYFKWTIYGCVLFPLSLALWEQILTWREKWDLPRLSHLSTQAFTFFVEVV